ncbi:PAS domain S-box protein [Oscillatoria salina]|uniref:PAS domain S-box protein n=1 Tax=Oscillatoria salina TaxID=331517 RepID=UPI0013B97CE2|nr:PAS domain S-box protein [Oscillatoria salina]MBZ8180186.1 PAS domain S-box protein [Oscillatoria salina IIICB1]NET90260.1 PAS domain S-box protein [Kamptonema sp. SIO1D9]
MKATRQKTIMIVDDRPNNLKLLYSFLQEEGFQVLVAKSGESALRKLAKVSPDLILLDVMMPGMDGFETCRRLKVMRRTRDIPTIFMTALTDKLDKVKGFEVGAVDYITKPFWQEEVLARINFHLQLRAAHQELAQKNQQLEQEIRSREQAEAALRESESKLRQIVNSIRDCFWMIDVQMKQVIYVSPAFEEIWGRSCQSIYDRREVWLESIHPEDRQKVVSFLGEIEKGETIEQEYRIVRPDGAVVWVLDRCFPVRNSSGEVYRFAGICRDITARKRTEQELQYRLLLEKVLAKVSKELATTEAVNFEQILKTLAIAVDANIAYLTRFRADGKIAEGISEWCCGQISAPVENWQNVDIFRFPWLIQQLQKKESVAISDVEKMPEMALGEKKFLQQLDICSLVVVPIFTHSGEIWGMIGFNNTKNNRKNWAYEDVQLLEVAGEMIYSWCDRASAWEKLRASEALYASIFNHSLEAIFLLDVLAENEFAYAQVNPSQEKVLGKPASELVGKNLIEVLPSTEAAKLQKRCQEAILRQTPLHYEESLVLPNGISIWLTSLVPITDATGRIVQLQGSARDITAESRQRQELARSNTELEQYAYVVSHDLQAPLGTIASYVQLLQKRYQNQLDAKADKFINNILSSTLRMQQLINDLLEYSRVGRNQKPFTLTDCNQVVIEVKSNLQAAIAKNQVRIDCEQLPLVMADRQRLVQLFQNLIGNAIKYRREEPPVIAICASFGGSEWLFAVSDNGIGIEAKYRERIFQIFQRLHTSTEYPGTGIGLALCQKIVQLHGGSIWVESQLGKGSTFYFTLLVR